MKLTLLLLSAALAAARPHNKRHGGYSANLYVSSYNGLVSTLRLQQEDDAFSLTNVTQNADCSTSPSILTFDLSGNLYCMNEALSYPTGGNSSVTMYTTRENGTLTKISRTDTIWAPVFGTVVENVAAGLKSMVLAHYTGAVSLFNIAPNGTFTPMENVTYPGSVPDPTGRQNTSHIHQAKLDPSGQCMLFPDLGRDVVRVWCVDPSSATMSIKEYANLTVAKGTGPRHLTFWSPHKYGATNSTLFMYLVTEMGNTLTGYKVGYPKTGGMTFTQVHNGTTYGTGPVPPVAYASEIKTSPDGRFLVVSNRNDSSFMIPNIDPKNSTQEASDSLAVFRPLRNGTLSFEGLSPAGGSYPRQFSFNRNGDMIAVGLQNSGRVVVIDRDVNTGKLGPALAFTTNGGLVTSVVFDD